MPLLCDHCAQDWRDVLPRIDVPTLVIGCDGSHVAPGSQRYIADQIPGAELHVFPSDVANSHFPFLENPAGVQRGGGGVPRAVTLSGVACRIVLTWNGVSLPRRTPPAAWGCRRTGYRPRRRRAGVRLTAREGAYHDGAVTLRASRRR